MRYIAKGINRLLVEGIVRGAYPPRRRRSARHPKDMLEKLYDTRKFLEDLVNK